MLPDFTLTQSNGAQVAQICALVDGLPLALELAAARMRSLSPVQLLAQLKSGMLPILTRGNRNAPDRHQTLRKTIAWSYDLLTAEEQVHFRRLSVFVGGWTLEAATAVCSSPEGTPPLRLETLERLDSLIEKSLVYRQASGKPSEAEAGWDKEPRFGMLETIREYALEELEASGERETLERAHADYFLALSEQAEPYLMGAEIGMWLERLEREYGNLQAALAWLYNHAKIDLALRMAAALWVFWKQRGYYVEGRGWLERLLEKAGETGVPLEEMSLFTHTVRAKALIGASELTWAQQDLERAGILAQQALALLRAEENLPWIVDALVDLGTISLDRGAFEEAVTYLTEGLALSREIGDEGRFQAAVLTLSLIRLAQGEQEQAQTLAEEGLTLARRSGNRRVQVLCLGILATVSMFRGNFAHGRVLNREALRIAGETGYVLGLATGLVVLAGAAALEGQGELAARLLGAEEARLERSEARLPAAMQRMVDQVVQPAREALGEEAWAKAYAAGRGSSLEEVLALTTLAETQGKEEPS
jgi:tetratricopeptide (TPR) repeat protein